MAAKTKAKKKSRTAKRSARAKSAATPAKSGGAGGDEPSAVLRASAKSFAARLLR